MYKSSMQKQAENKLNIQNQQNGFWGKGEPPEKLENFYVRGYENY